MPRAPFAALLLSLLAVLAPDLTLAPAVAFEPGNGPRPIDEAALPIVPRIPQPAGADTRTAGEPAAVPLATSEGPRFAAALDAARTLASSYGVTFAAVRDGDLLWAGSVGRERDGRTALVPNSPLVIGSATKTFVAAAVLELAEEGALELDDSARAHLPQLKWLSREITIRQLLDHTSGLADVFNDTTRKGLEEEPGHAWTSDELLRTLHSPWYQPGENWAYANTNYYLLGLVIERVTGSSLADELARRFLEPLDLDATRVLSPTDAAGPLAPAWTTIFWGSGAMEASAADLARWGDALYGGSVIAPDSQRAMLQMNDNDYGLGAQRIEIPGFVGRGHTGLLNTYTTLLLNLPEEHLTIALLVNRSHVDLVGMLLTKPLNGGPSLLELSIGHELPQPSPTASPQSP